MTWWRATPNDVRSPDPRIFLAVSAALSFSLAAPTTARAQLAGAATLESEYRLRGVALSDGEPVLRLGLSYDHASGAYAGVSAIVGQTAHSGVRPLGYVAFVGVAGQAPQGLSWDVGASNSQITLYLPAARALRPLPSAIYPQTNTYKYTANYTEIYGGLSARDVSARLYLSPDYLGQDLKAAYLDVTAAARPIRRLRLYGHVGALTPLGGSARPDGDREQYDVATGAAWEYRHGEIQLAWSAAAPEMEYPVGYRQKRSALVLSLTDFF
jgi:hypothetical protein